MQFLLKIFKCHLFTLLLTSNYHTTFRYLLLSLFLLPSLFPPHNHINFKLNNTGTRIGKISKAIFSQKLLIRSLHKIHIPFQLLIRIPQDDASEIWVLLYIYLPQICHACNTRENPLYLLNVCVGISRSIGPVI